VGTASAVYDAVVRRKPLLERVVTFSGDALKTPANLLVRIGTPLTFLFEHLGGFTAEPKKILVGGPMMGVAQFNTDIGVSKACSGVLAISNYQAPKEYNCINCCRCVYHCPMFLVPTKIVRFAKHGIWEKTEDFGAPNCIECGSCSYECPSNIPLVQWIRVAKRRLVEIDKSSGS
jgi:electron transport complex protein RnfC